MQMNAWSYEPVSSKKQIKDNLKIEPSIKVYTNLAKASECAFKDQIELWYGLYLDTTSCYDNFQSLRAWSVITLYHYIGDYRKKLTIPVSNAQNLPVQLLAWAIVYTGYV